MAVKMPVLGDSSRRRTRLPAVGLVLLAAALLAAGYVWRWRTLHRRVDVSTLPRPAHELGGAALPGVTPGAEQPAESAAAQPASGPRHVSVKVDGALETALVQATGRDTGPALAQVLKRLLVWWMKVPADLQKGDRVDVLYEERAGEEPIIVAVRIVSAKLQRTLEAFRFRATSSEFPRYYLADGEELEVRLVPSPLDSYEQVTSLIRDGRGHKGVDFKTPVGSPVKATFAGRVTRKNWFFRGNGNSLEVTESAGPHRKALFLHLSELPKTLIAGASVSQGEVIARSGNSGHSFAAHLHYQLESADGRVLDPFQEHPTRRVALPSTDSPSFEALVANARQQLDRPPVQTAASRQTSH
jgi:murein DD-endopeptidase